MKQIQHCPACQDTQKKLRGEKNNFNIFSCQTCGSLLTFEKGKKEGFDYCDYYDGHNLEVPEFVNKRLTEIVRSFEKFRQNNRFLDVGCGAGTLLNAAIGENWDVQGLEVSAPSVEHLRRKGIKVFHGDLNSAKFPSDHFDVVTSVEVLEHVEEPEKLLKEIYRILRPGGLFWGTTPHGKGASARLLGAKWSCVAPPEHLQLFSVKGIRILLSENKFRNIKIKTQGINPIEIINTIKQSNLSSSNESGTETFNSTASAYEINAAFSNNSFRRSIKNFLNNVLDVTKLGDSLKIWAEK